MNRTSNQSQRSSSYRARTGTYAAKGKRTSVKAVAQRQASRRGAVRSRNLKRVKSTRASFGIRVIAVFAIFIVIAAAGAAAVFFQNESNKYTSSEAYRLTVNQACTDCGLDSQWTDCLLAAMVIESGADERVGSVRNVDGDIMQAAEGAYGWVVANGWPEHGVTAETPKASIYAGVMEFKQNLQLWEDYLGPITPEDTTEIQLVVQGYNFGAAGWFSWCENRGIRAYTVELAKEYSDTVMPAGAKGTPTHAQKWLNAYKKIHGE
jgi:hypothetical protein